MKWFRLIAILTVALLPASGLAAEKLLTIVHTNDLHSHFQGFSPEIDYRPEALHADKTDGGWARVAAVIFKTRKEKGHPVLVLDAGDFSMGSLFHMLTREEAFELRLLKTMGYDAVTLGNHEFDLRPSGLAAMLRSAKRHGGGPPVLFAQAVFDPGKAELTSLAAAFAETGVQPYIVLERDGLRIGVFGLFGKNAMEFSPFAKPLRFSDPIETARRMVELLRNREKADLVICLSHGGLHKNPKFSEDERLAKEVPGIDVIVSGHSHTQLDRPILIGGTIIVQAWCYGKQVGILDLVWKDGKVVMKQYEPVRITSAIAADADVQRQIDAFKRKLDDEFLRPLGLAYDQVIAETKWDLVNTAAESPLGNLLADSIRWSINKVDSDPADPASRVAVAVESNGIIRDDLVKGTTGKIVLSDLIRTFPMGIGPDNAMGYPLISFYLYGYEIKRAMEILTSVRPLKKNDDYFLQVSGLKVEYNPRRMFFDRVTRMQIGSEEEGYELLDHSRSNKRLYRVAANLYNATFLKMVGQFTFSFLEIVPKDKNGRPIEDLTKALVDADPVTPGVQELKEWRGLVDYVKSFRDDDGDGIPDIPAKYAGRLGRIVETPSIHPVHLLSRAEKPTLIAVTALSALILLMVGMVLIVKKKLTSQRRRKTDG